MCGLLNFKDQIIHFIHSFIHQQWNVFGVCLCVYMTCMYMFITCVHVHVCEYKCLWTTEQRTVFSVGYHLPAVSRQGLLSLLLSAAAHAGPVDLWTFGDSPVSDSHLCLGVPDLGPCSATPHLPWIWAFTLTLSCFGAGTVPAEPSPHPRKGNFEIVY